MTTAPIDVRVISIGALPAHPLWNERGQVRTGHATTSLLTFGSRRMLVDPGLPEPALVARLAERANLRPDDITDVFLTCFRPDVRRALHTFARAQWWVSEAERESVGVPLARRLAELTDHADDADDEGDTDLRRALEADIGLLARCKPAPDHFAEGLSLFPLPGVTPGMSGLLAEGPRFATLICGDAVPTVEHLEQGKVLPAAVDLDAARASLAEAVEIAELLVLGRDNLVVNPTKRPF